MTAALELAGPTSPCFCGEGRPPRGERRPDRFDVPVPRLGEGPLTERITRVTKNPKITVLLKSEVESISGYIGNFKAQVRTAGGEPREIEMGSIIVCTGFKEFDATRAGNFGTASSRTSSPPMTWKRC
jgi:heterodisulfide reductase subunit A-like polyferredoxin